MRTSASPLRVVLLDPAQRVRAGDAWQELEAAGADGSLTCGWDWTSTWLEHFGDHVPHVFALAQDGDAPVAIALLTFSGNRLRGRTLHVGTAGEPRAAAVFVEHNAVTAMPGTQAAFAAGLLAAVRARGGWDRIALDGFRPEAARDFTNDGRWRFAPQSCPVTDLAELRSAGGDISTVLSGSRGQRVRRSLRAFDALGDEWCDHAEQADEALAELAAINRDRWAGSGVHTPFSDRRFVDFHRGLIRRLAPRGQAWVLRVSAGRETIAALYCLRDAGRVLFYQSGVRTFSDNRLRPGIAGHVRSINACAARGLDVYDFLAPPDRYKLELATGSSELLWASSDRITPLVLARRAASAARAWTRDRA